MRTDGPIKDILVPAVDCAVNAVVAFLWLFLYGWRYSFRLGGVYFTSGHGF